MKRIRRQGRILAFVCQRLPAAPFGLSFWLGLIAVASACPTCKSALAENDPGHQQLVAGYFYSILFMMSVPFILLGAFGSYAYLIVRRARHVDRRFLDKALESS